MKKEDNNSNKDLNKLFNQIDRNNQNILNNFIPDYHKYADPAATLKQVNVPLSTQYWT